MASSSSSDGAPIALVTGGGRGLGLTIARHLADLGWHTVIAGRDRQTLRRAVEAAAAEGLELYPVQADVTSEESVGALFQQMDGPPDLCVNNAGSNYNHKLVGGRTGGLRPHPFADWETTVRLCLTGTFLVSREAAAAMLAADTPGTIVNISSAVRNGAFGQSAYAAAKAGVESLTRTWAVELGECGIRVVAIAPGVLDGDALRRRSTANPRHAEYMSRLREQIPLRRWCDEQDVAEAVAFAAANPSLTGTVIEIDGGGLPRRVFNTSKDLA